MWMLVALALAAAQPALATVYCSNNTFTSNSSYMQFTKEAIPFDYGIQGQFKSIHCCVKGYRSIEWFRDDIAYPWSATVSNFILYPEAANQTLYTQRAARSDSGNYTCRLSNDTHSHNHTINLHILDKATDVPKHMFISNNQRLEEGDELRLYCEALIGRSYLADARSDLCWRKEWPNGTESDLLPTQIQIKNHREEEIIGAYLSVRRMSTQDFGRYVCVVHSNDVVSKHYVYVDDSVSSGWKGESRWRPGGGASGVPWRALSLSACGIALAVLTLAVLHRRCTPRLLLAVRHARDRHRTAAHRARVLEKEFDVLVCCTAVDASLVRGALLPTLTLKYNYRVLPVLVSTQTDTWYEELVMEAARCRSLVAVVSPVQHSPQQLLTALRHLRALSLPPVVVLLQDLPKLKREAKEAGESLVGVLRRTRLVPWRHVHERDFWTALRLALPLPPPATPPTVNLFTTPLLYTVKSSIVEAEESKNSRSCSLTALV